MKQIHEIERCLNIGERDIQLYVDMYVDGELKVSKKADSLLINFIEMLFTQMSGQFYTPADSYVYAAGAVTGGGTGTPIVINIDQQPNTGWVGMKCYVAGVEGTVGTNGLFTVQNYSQSPNSITLQNSTGSGTYTKGGSYWLYPNQPLSMGRSYQNLKLYSIRVGMGSGSVSIVDKYLGSSINTGTGYNQLVYNAQTVSQDTSDSVSAQVTMTRTFTNSTGATVTVNEVGLSLAAYDINTNSTHEYLCGRDLITGGIGVNNGATLTVNYRIKTTLGGTGGLVQQFMQQLYRQLAQTTRQVLDITNTNTNWNSNNAVFIACGPGSNSAMNMGSQAYFANVLAQTQGQNLGIVVGTDNTAVAMTDYALHSKIQHGSGSGQLYHYGTIADPLFVDYQNNTVSFNFIRLLENLSPGTVTIKEMGLYTGDSNASSSSDANVIEATHCIERDALASANWITLNPGDIAKVIYKVQITL
jgi:hypothetical protein